MKKEYVRYILQFLLGEENIQLLGKIFYGDENDANDEAIIIKPSDFFSDGVYLTEKSIPRLPLGTIDGIPILFGEARVTNDGNRLVIYADIVAGTFFSLRVMKSV